MDDACRLYFNLLEKKLVAYLTNWLKWDKEEALAIFADSFLVIYQKVVEGQLNDMNQSYAKEICKRLGANNYRKAIKEKERFSEYLHHTQTSYVNDLKSLYGIEINLTTDESRSANALKAFSVLDEKCQELIKLRYIEDFSHQEIAGKLKNISGADSSKTLLNRCINKWKELMKKY